MSGQSLYKPIFCKRFIDMSKEGKTVAQFAALVGVARRTVYDWSDVHSDFRDAFMIGRTLCQAYYENIAKDLIDGKIELSKEQATFLMKRLITIGKDDWSEARADSDAAKAVDSMTADQIDAELKKLMDETNVSVLPVKGAPKK
jgi:hypothetical protein